ncbi:MAG: muconolactone Delta-isomerase family protein [Thermodesulfobacteriota bacterium]
MFRSICIVSAFVASLLFLSGLVSHAAGMKYLVKGSSGSVSLSSEDMAQLLENVVIPSLDQLAKWEKEGKVTGGLPVGQRAFVFIVEASSNEELDQMLRSLPIWGGMKWKVIPLQSFSGREGMEKNILTEMKKN